MPSIGLCCAGDAAWPRLVLSGAEPAVGQGEGWLLAGEEPGLFVNLSLSLTNALAQKRRNDLFFFFFFQNLKAYQIAIFKMRFFISKWHLTVKDGFGFLPLCLEGRLWERGTTTRNKIFQFSFDNMFSVLIICCPKIPSAYFWVHFPPLK